VTCGVPQGSVLGPALWNVFYEELLEIEMPPGVQIVAFVDLLNPVLNSVSNWIHENGLQLAPQKSEAVVLTNKHRYDKPRLYVERYEIPVKPAIRYLGVELDTRLSFTTHVATACRKAIESARAIGRLMPNVGGPLTSKRALLGTVVHSKLLYASPNWASRATKTAKNRDAMARAQRSVALRIIRAYRTLSTVGASVFASMVPADLLAIERGRIRHRLDDQDDVTETTIMRKQERKISIAAWQARWDRVRTARWTHRLLPDLGRWLEKPPMSMSYRLTQALSGHGCFKEYLLKMNRAEDSYCVYCVDPNDTAEHALFYCPR